MSEVQAAGGAGASFVLAGGVSLWMRGADPSALAQLEGLMDPYRAEPGAPEVPGLVLEQAPGGSEPAFTDIHNPARDGVVTAADGESVYLLDGCRWCSLPDPSGRIRFAQGFPIRRLLIAVVRPALQLALAENGAPSVHSAAVEVDGGGVVVAGWSETGKTEVALGFLENGARFISDKWSILLPDGTLGTFPITVGIRRWVLPHLPMLNAALPARARGQLRVAGGLATVTGPLRRRGLPGRIGSLAVGSLDRAISLADRAALTPTAVAAAYGHAVDSDGRVPLKAVAILTTVPGGSEPSVRMADPRWAARRLARSAAYERRGFGELLSRSRYAFPDGEGPIDALGEGRDERLLEAAFARVPVIEARVPFPTDPRRVADLIAGLL